jgi:hypothetical protein
MSAIAHAPVPDRVRANTWPGVNERLDTEAQLRLGRAAASGSSDDLTRQVAQLDYEWDFDRVLETEASLMGLIGLALGVTLDKRLLVLPGVVATMMLLHASHGWYPLLPLFRRLGVRTRNEIDQERYGLKGLRGDFAALPPAHTHSAERAAAVWRAVCE